MFMLFTRTYFSAMLCGAWPALRGVCLLLCCVVFPSLVHGMGGVEFDARLPHFASGASKDDFVDLRVKVLGGEVRITRRWNGEAWEWNRRWNDLELLGVDLEEEPPLFSGRIDDSSSYNSGADTWCFPSAAPYAILRNGQAYVLNERPRCTDHTATYYNLAKRTITVRLDDLGAEALGYFWQDRSGNTIHYDRSGRILWYANRNGVRVTIDRDSDGDYQFIRDHHGTAVATFYYETVNGEKRVDRLEDYSGRVVDYHYDDVTQHLTHVTDVRGEDWLYSYNANSLTGYTDPEGRETRLQINNDGELRQRFSAEGVGYSVDYSYDKAKEEYYLATTDGDGYVTEWWFNRLGQAVRQDIDGERQYSAVAISSKATGSARTISDKYRALTDSSRGPRRVIGGVEANIDLNSNELEYIRYRVETDARGNQTRYEFDSYGNVIQITHADDSVWASTYNQFAEPLVTIDERGIVTERIYYPNGDLQWLIEARGRPEERRSQYFYDAYGQVQRIVFVADSTTAESSMEYRYDNYGNVTHVIDALQLQTVYSDFDALGNARNMLDRRQHNWQRGYDAAGNLLTDQNPYGDGVTYGYDRAGYLNRITTIDNVVYTVQTDSSGLPLTLTDADGNETGFTFNKRRQLTEVTDANGHRYQFDYDPQGRLRASIDGRQQRTEYHYRATLLDSIHYPTYTETLGYDTRNRVNAQREQGGALDRLRGMGYDVTDNQISYDDANQSANRFVYDGLRRLVEYHDADAGVTILRYDDRDNLLEVEDPEQRRTVYAYTVRDELASETRVDDNGNTHQRRYDYDENGNRNEVINAKNEKTVYRYDDANRLIHTDFYTNAADSAAQSTQQYHYNAIEQYSGYTRGELGETIGYDNLGRVDNVTVDLGPFNKTIQYTYYPNGLKHTYTSPEGAVYTYAYTGNNELASVNISGVGTMSYQYNQDDWLYPSSQRLPGGHRIAYDYDALQRPAYRELIDVSNNQRGTATYGYDNESNITQLDTHQGRATYGYDALYRLDSWTHYSGSGDNETIAAGDSYTYDGVGNRLTTAASSTEWDYDARNALTSQPGISYTQDANGHTVSKTEGSDVTTYQYDLEERLIRVELNGSVLAQYRYNAYGQRVSKTVNGSSIYYLYNDEGLAAEYDATGQLIKEYHFTPNQPWMTRPLFQRDAATGDVYFYHNDHLGTPQQLLSVNGAIVWESRYNAFGQAQIVTQLIDNNLRFPGQYFDAETGLHHNYFRDYDPSLGRYLQSDPIGLEGGINTYGYAFQNPVMYTDPDGLVWIRLGGAAIGALGDIAFQMAFNGGWKCVDLTDVAMAAALGAINPAGAFNPFKDLKKGFHYGDKANAQYDKAMKALKRRGEHSRQYKRHRQREAKHRRRAGKEFGKFAAPQLGLYTAQQMTKAPCDNSDDC